MAEIVLNAKPRERTGKGAARAYRNDGLIPAEYYSARHDNLHLLLNRREFDTLLSTAFSLLELEVEGEKNKKLCIVKDMQFHPVRGNVLHVDFQGVVRGEKLTVNVPFVLTGTAEGVKSGGILEHLVREIEVECLPKDIPEKLEYDVTNLQIGDSIHISDLDYPQFKILNDPEETIVQVIASRVAQEPTPEEAAEMAEEEEMKEPEVITEKKETEE